MAKIEITTSKLKKISLVVLLIGITAFNILIDFLEASFDTAIFLDVYYWAKLAAVNVAAILVLYCTRSLVKEKEKVENTKIVEMQDAIDKAYVEINNRNLNGELANYIDMENRRRHLNAYLSRLRKKLLKAKCEVRVEELQTLIDNADKDYDLSNVKYYKVRFATLFSTVSVRSDDDNDLEEHEGREKLEIAFSKILYIFAFGVLTTSFAFEPKEFGLSIIYTSLCKIMQMIISAYTGAMLGSDYTKGVYFKKLTLRLNFIQQFLEQRKNNKEQEGA